MSGPVNRSTVVVPLRAALEALDALAQVSERAACAALMVEAIGARAMLAEAAEFDGVHL